MGRIIPLTRRGPGAQGLLARGNAALGGFRERDGGTEGRYPGPGPPMYAAISFFC
jgi:hypothetical protein